MQIDQIAVVVGVTVPVTILVVVVAICFIIRRLRPNHSYQQVNHDLDEEEIEFKRILENRKDNQSLKISDFDEDDDDISFSTNEINRLQMLEKYRNNLVAGVNSTTIAADNDGLRL